MRWWPKPRRSQKCKLSLQSFALGRINARVIKPDIAAAGWVRVITTGQPWGHFFIWISNLLGVLWILYPVLDAQKRLDLKGCGMYGVKAWGLRERHRERERGGRRKKEKRKKKERKERTNACICNCIQGRCDSIAWRCCVRCSVAAGQPDHVVPTVDARQAS